MFDEKVGGNIVDRVSSIEERQLDCVFQIVDEGHVERI